MEKAVKGFEETGICPLNPHIFDEEDISIADPIIEEASRQKIMLTKRNKLKENLPKEMFSNEDEDNMENKEKKVRQGEKKAKLTSKKCGDSSSEDSMDDVPLTQLCNDDDDDDIENRGICAVWS
ncbi:hypothetical protein HHI36_023699 [Cryptolaemus montrouzieri]|uniref:Uncharacterized protein n=1 Tax=Cryptolaemus montrouzieri TaxID=559131 RepID=A0ABD2PHT7_9CUCU